MKKAFLPTFCIFGVSNFQKNTLKNFPTSALLFIFSLITQGAIAQVSGNVFNDFNNNGTKDATTILTEVGLGGVTVKAYDASGASVSTTTAANGSYSFPNSGITASGKAVRLEFTNFPTYGNSSTSGSTAVQFVTAGTSTTNANLPVIYASDYCQTNPVMVTPCYVETASLAEDVVVKWSYNNTGTAALDKTAIAKSATVGALWGMTYDRIKKVIYTSAVLKAHVPLGAEGLDAIYTVDPTTGSPNSTPWLQLTDDLGIAVSSVSANPQYLSNATRGVLTPPSNDAQAFVDVGKVGIGDIDLSTDGQILYVVNLYDKKLYAIDVNTKTLQNSFAIPNPGCVNGVARPWAMGEYAGEIYVGVTCDGSASGVPSNLSDNSGASNLKATIYKLAGGSSFTQVLTFPLDYPREPPFQYSTGCDLINRWKPWTDVVPATCADGNIGYPTPLLTDIEFDDNGNMVLGFTDRTGYQFGFENYGKTGTTLYSIYAGGEILRACKTSTGWSIEDNSGTCKSAEGLAINTTDTNGYLTSGGTQLSKPGEFYLGDYFHSDGGLDNTGISWYPGHPEITLGALTIVPGTGEVMSIAYDPVTGSPNYNTGGVITLSNTTGKRPRNGFELYNTPTGGVTQGKGVGFGDLEALCNPAPIEFGNRLWFDADEDGIQDPGELPIAGVELKLYAANGTTLLGTTTTNTNGEWEFNSLNVSAGILPKTDYVIKVTTPLNTGALAGYKSFTIADQTNGTTDMADSDASALGVITINSGLPGASNYNLDIGLTQTPKCTLPNCGTVTVTKN